MQADLIKDELISEINAVISGSKLDFKVNATHSKSPKVVFGLAAEKLDFNTLFPPLPAKPAPAKVANDSAAPAETAPATAKSPPAAQSASATPSLSFLDSVDLTGTVANADLKVTALTATNFAESWIGRASRREIGGQEVYISMDE